jgi:hypothetical protein
MRWQRLRRLARAKLITAAPYLLEVGPEAVRDAIIGRVGKARSWRWWLRRMLFGVAGRGRSRAGAVGPPLVPFSNAISSASAFHPAFSTVNRVRITRAVYEPLNKDKKYSSDTHMWSNEVFKEIGGVSRAYRWSTWRWKIS